jgi:hypothetical protein
VATNIIVPAAFAKMLTPDIIPPAATQTPEPVKKSAVATNIIVPAALAKMLTPDIIPPATTQTPEPASLSARVRLGVRVE